MLISAIFTTFSAVYSVPMKIGIACEFGLESGKFVYEKRPSPDFAALMQVETAASDKENPPS